jgi:hypothetical protein
MSKSGLSIRAKLTLVTLLILGLSGLGSAGILYTVYRRSTNAASEEALKGAATAYDAIERYEAEKLSTALDVAIANTAIRDAFAARDRERLYALTGPVLQSLKAEHGINIFNFVEGEPDRQMVVLRVQAPSRYGDTMRRANLGRAMEKHEVSAGKELGRNGFALRVARPYSVDGKIIGYVEMGEDIDAFLDKLKDQTGNDFAMFIQKKFMDATEYERSRGTARNNWSDFPEIVVVNHTAGEQDPIVDEVAIQALSEEGRILPLAERDNALYARGVFPVRDASGKLMGGLALRRDITKLRDGMRTSLLLAIAGAIILALVAAAMVYLSMDRLIFSRLEQMKSAMQDASMRLAGGDFSAGDAIPPSNDDEIGSFQAFLGEFLGVVRNTLADLTERLKQAKQSRAAGPSAR